MSRAAVAVLMGGPDAEHAVSIGSGSAVAAALRSAGWTVHEHVIDQPDARQLGSLAGDIIFPVLHGPWGEGGPLQALLEQDSRPFIGSPAEAAARCMDKGRAKQLAAELSIATPTWALIHAADGCPITPPVVVKPNDDGSSVDLQRCDTADEADAAVNTMVQARGAALVEQWIVGRELTVGIVCGDPLPIVEIVPHGGVYDYAAKYHRDDTQYIVHPPLDPKHAEHMIESAVALCEQAGVQDVARVDYLLDKDGPWFLEINTMPGFTDHSLLPMAAMAVGWDMPTLCDRLVRAAQRSGSASVPDPIG